MRLSKIFLLLLSLSGLLAKSQAQTRRHYDSALQYLIYRLPENLKNSGEKETGFQIIPNFTKAELTWFEKELDSLYTPKELRKIQKNHCLLISLRKYFY